MKPSISFFALILLLHSATSQCFATCETSHLALVSGNSAVVSRKTHGAAGTFDIALPQSGTPGVECRSGASGYTLVFSFTNDSEVGGTAITVNGATISVGTATGISYITSGMQCTVNLTGVADQQNVIVSLEGVHDSLDYINVSATMTVLLGDTIANAMVNATDVSQVKNESGNPVGAGNFRSDITADGSINSTDVSVVKLASGHGVLPADPLSRLTVCDERFLCAGNTGKFFWLGDTAWWLMNVNDSYVSEYLTTRAAQKFTGIQIMALMLQLPSSPQTTLHTKEDFYEHSPLANGELNPTCRTSPYWSRFKWIVDEAERKGLYVGVFLVWGNEINGTNGYFNSNDTAKAQTYAQDLATLLRDNKNVWYSVSGEYDAGGSASDALFASLAGGLAAGSDPKEDPPIVGIHPSVPQTSVTHFANAPWLRIHMLQSGHQFDHVEDSIGRTWKQTDELIDEGYLATNFNRKPIFDAEPMYDNIVDKAYYDGHVNDPRANASIVRFKAYEAVFAGACGHTYGHDNVHNFWTVGDDPDRPYTRAIYWKTAINSNNYPGAGQLRYLLELIKCHSQNRIPAQCFIRKEGDPSLCAPDVYTGLSHIRATRDSAGTYALVYVPQGNTTFHVDMTMISGTSSTAQWFNPETGEPYGGPISHSHTSTYQAFTSPAARSDPPDYVNDWVLVLESNEFPGCD